MELKNNVVLITGASSGLGREMAIAFARNKCRLMITSNEDAALCNVVNEIKGLSATVKSIVGDLTDDDFIKRLAKETITLYDKVDILINNAGIMIPEKLGFSSIRNWNKVLAVNLTAPFNLSNELIPMMNEKAIAPLIINVSSVSGVVGSPFCASYVASKYGLVGLTDAINEEFRIHGRVRSIAICPGTMETASMRKINQPGISPRPDESVLEPKEVADFVLYIAKIRDHMDIAKVVFKRRKPV
jgi:NAD(P)-dependent dehydrogenase (short-subunit alcohol dehydrogenase family)